MTLMLDVPAASDEDAAQREKRLRAAIAMFDAQLVTQGQAAELAGLSRVEFFEALGRHGVTPFQYDMAEEVAAVAALETPLTPASEGGRLLTPRGASLASA